MVTPIRRCLAIGSLILALSILTQGQEAQVEIDGDEIVKAGETVECTVTLDKAPNFEGGLLSLGFGLRDGTGATSATINTHPGQAVYHLKAKIPAAAPGGVWALLSLQFNNTAAWINLPHKEISFRVLSDPALVYPTSAEIQVNPSQIQLLRREAVQLQTRLQTLRASVAGQAEPLTTSTLESLRNRVGRELDLLKSTETQFVKLGDHSQADAAQIFFDDLRIGYDETLSGLRLEKAAGPVAKLLLSSQKKQATRRFPPAAQLVFRAFELNELAYNLVVDTATLAFDLEVNSNPEGATVSYKRRGDAFKQHQSPTNSTIKSLPYAEWTIRFQKQGYRDQEVDFNPFVERNRVITANLRK